MRQRLRPAWTPDQLDALYAVPYNHQHWGYSHGLRMDWTAAWAQRICRDAASVADLSCGDGALLDTLDVPAKIYGDAWPGPRSADDGWVVGFIEDTVHAIPPVDVFLCTETIEHLDDPDTVLAAIRADQLLVTTPLAEPGEAHDQHYWTWDADGVEALLTDAGWTPRTHHDLVLPDDTLSYQLWIARR